MSARFPAIRGALNILASSHFVYRRSPLRWLVRVEPEVPGEDSEWRLYSASDTPEFIEGEGNFVIISFNEAGVIEPMIMPMYFQPVGTELRLVDLPQQMRKAWFDENSRDENGTLRELALDDAFWDQFNRDYDAWYAEHPLPGAPGRPQP
ncbi:immunity protein Imm33 domain-containing protein [Pauljensenia hongkongensis]|nr:DUF2185 domain-containing protein [Pauljensenia hongkongensis]EFW10935.1 hypothetical protein HMPREF9005_0092 [Actinomyces sp. oral taxon 178 str. F0338]